MYENECKQVEKPKHIEIAENIAREVGENFDPNQQNEMVKVIVDVIRKRRSIRIETVSAELSYLQESLIQIKEV